MGPDPELLRLIESSLEFTYGYGDVTPVAPPHDTGWRTLPFLVTAEGTSETDCEGVVDVAGRPSIRGRSGGALCVAPGVHHRCRVTAGSGVSRWSCTTYTILQGIDLFALVEPRMTIPGEPGRRIGAINRELAALAREPQPSLRRIARTRELGFALLAIVLDHAEWRPHRDQLALNAQRLVPVFEHIRRNLGRRLAVAELARHARLSPPRFHAVFRRATGMPPQRYVQGLRLRKAQELLIATDLPIGEIAARVGHDDAFLFSRIFAKRCGMSPKAYRSRVVEPLV